MSQKAHSLLYTKRHCSITLCSPLNGEIFYRLCSYKGVEIIEGHLMPDHVDMLVSILSRINVSSFMGYLKGKIEFMMFDKYANLKYKFENRHFWTEGYYVSMVGLNEATIKKYILD